MNTICPLNAVSSRGAGTLVVLFISWAGLSLAQPAFEPVKEVDKALYRFDFPKLFYKDEAARQKDLAVLEVLAKDLEGMKPVVTQSGANLLKAIKIKEAMVVIADRLQSYGGLRQAVNTADATANTEDAEGSEARDRYDASIAFIEAALQKLTHVEVAALVESDPGLQGYAFYIKEVRRYKAHTAPEAVETALRSLGSRLDPFGSNFYTLMGDRAPDVIITAGGRKLNVTKPNDYLDILHLDDRNLREDGFRKRMATYKAQGDLYAYALFEKARTASSVAELRGFDNAMDAAFFEYYLSPATVDAVLGAFKKRASVAMRFQKVELEYQRKRLGLSSAEPWDVDYSPANDPEPRYEIRQGSDSVKNALKVFGAEYGLELEKVLDPSNGRIDLVAGPNRIANDFTWGYYSPSWVLYMRGYNGYLKDLVTLAHESAHVVHYSLIYHAKVVPSYGDGARYFTEGFAKVNELLILDHLAKTAGNDAERLFYLRMLCSKLASVKFASMYWAAYATNFELDVYRRVKSKQIKKPEEIHEVWAEYGRLWMTGFDRQPDLKYTWPDTPHFFNSSRYYSNYLFAWVIALAVYEKLQSDPTFAGKFVDLMKTGFSDEPGTLLKERLGIDLEDNQSLDRMFDTVESYVRKFEEEVKKM